MVGKHLYHVCVTLTLLELDYGKFGRALVSWKKSVKGLQHRPDGTIRAAITTVVV